MGDPQPDFPSVVPGGGCRPPIGLSLYSRMTARRSPVVVDAVRRPLTPPEIGALTSDYQAVLASMAILRSAELISTEGKTKAGTHCGGQESSRLVSPRTVHKRLGNGKVPLRQVRLMGRLNVALAQLRTTLIDEGYLQRQQDGLTRCPSDRFRSWRSLLSAWSVSSPESPAVSRSGFCSSPSSFSL